MSNGNTGKARDIWGKLQVIADIIGKLFIPILVIVIPLSIANTQKKQHEAQIEEAAVENFYKNISSDNPEQQNLAVGALKMVKPELGVKLAGNLTGLETNRRLDLANSIVTDEAQSEEVKTETKRIVEELAKDERQPPAIREKAIEIIQQKPERDER